MSTMVYNLDIANPCATGAVVVDVLSVEIEEQNNRNPKMFILKQKIAKSHRNQ